MDKITVARKLLEGYLKHRREAEKSKWTHNKGIDNSLMEVYSGLWNDFNFNKEFGLIDNPDTQQNFK